MVKVKEERKYTTHGYTEMHSIISVYLLSNPTDGRILNQFVALPLQADSFLCVCPSVWIHPTADRAKENNHLRQSSKTKLNATSNVVNEKR